MCMCITVKGRKGRTGRESVVVVVAAGGDTMGHRLLFFACLLIYIYLSPHLYN